MEVLRHCYSEPCTVTHKMGKEKKKKASPENSVLDLSKLLYPLSLYFVLAQMKSVSDVTSKKNQ